MKKFYTLVIFLISLFYSSFYYGNYMLIQNVAMTGENTGAKTVQVQFDISWENSWLDEVNFDAAWVFIKYKDTNGDWHHATINTDGYSNGSGTQNYIDVTDDKVGAFLRRNNILGSGNFDADNVQLQWAYGSDGLSDINGIEIRVFAIEMVYVPEGDFNCSPYITRGYSEKTFLAPGANAPVINSRLSPVLRYNGDSLRIKGNAGIDTDNDGVVDNTTFPTGYFPFYCFKYELTEQQYADFLNTLSPSQIANLGIAGTNISLINDVYVSTTPNKVCKASANFTDQFLSYADWCGLRPMSMLELNKAAFGPEYLITNTANQSEYARRGNTASNHTNYIDEYYSSPVGPQENGEETVDVTYFYSNTYDWGSGGNPNRLQRAGIFAAGVNASHGNNARAYSGGSYYGIMDLTGSLGEPAVHFGSFDFSTVNGNGTLGSDGYSDVSQWGNSTDIQKTDFHRYLSYSYHGFRYVRSALDLMNLNIECNPPNNFILNWYSLNPDLTSQNYGYGISGGINFNVNKTFSWESSGDVNEWIVEYGPEGFALGSGTTVTVNETSFSVPILNNEAIYDFYVSSVCNQESSFQVGPIKTNCDEYIFTVIKEDFNPSDQTYFYFNINLSENSHLSRTTWGFWHFGNIAEESHPFFVNKNEILTITDDQWDQSFWSNRLNYSWKIYNKLGVEIATGDFNDLPKTIPLTCE